MSLFSSFVVILKLIRVLVLFGLGKGSSRSYDSVVGDMEADS